MGWCKKDITPLLTHWSYVFLAPTYRYKTERNLNVATGQLRPSRSNLHFLRADAKYHVNKLQEKGEEPIEQEQIIASDRQEVAAKWSRFIFWVGGLSQQAGKQSQLPSIPRAVCEIVFAEVIDHRSRVKMIHHRRTVYTYRPVMLS